MVACGVKGMKLCLCASFSSQPHCPSYTCTFTFTHTHIDTHHTHGRTEIALVLCIKHLKEGENVWVAAIAKQDVNLILGVSLELVNDLHRKLAPRCFVHCALAHAERAGTWRGRRVGVGRWNEGREMKTGEGGEVKAKYANTNTRA